MKYALVFPGQGAQHVGMGKNISENYPEAAAVFEKSNEILGYDIRKLIFEGPEAELRQTINTQPAVFTASISCFEALKKNIPSIISSASFAAGHSLGEYTALYAAGAFDLASGLKLVRKRAEFIQEGSQKNKGTMTAIMGLDEKKLGELCANASSKGVVEMVNFNAPGQIVISGTIEAVNEASEIAKASGAMKIIPLAVSGPFHSSLLKEAAVKMGNVLKETALSDPKIPVVANCDAVPMKSSLDIRVRLTKQIDNPVWWEKTIKYMIGEGVDTFIEIGPGKVISGMVKRINRQSKTLNIEDMASLESAVKEIAAAGV